MPGAIELLAPAKVNPHLCLLGRRADGYHELDTLLLTVDLTDRLLLRPRPELAPGAVELVLGGPQAGADIPRDGSNLVVRAARAALESAGADVGLGIELTKRIPSRAGLGGGSSDAAAAVAGVEALLGIDLGVDRRTRILAKLGSDCVFFDRARTTGCGRGTGRGECIELLAPPRDWWAAIVTPTEGCSTAEVYAATSLPLSPPPGAPTVQSLLAMGADEARIHLHNDLEAAALAVSPTLRHWRDLLSAAESAPFLLAGSGASFFGLFADEEAAQAALERVLAEAGRRGLAVRGRFVARAGVQRPEPRAMDGGGIPPGSDRAPGGA